MINDEEARKGERCPNCQSVNNEWGTCSLHESYLSNSKCGKNTRMENKGRISRNKPDKRHG